MSTSVKCDVMAVNGEKVWVLLEVKLTWIKNHTCLVIFNLKNSLLPITPAKCWVLKGCNINPGWMTLLSVNENLPTVLCSFHSSVQGINEGWIELRQPLKLLDFCHRSIESRAKAAVCCCDELCWRPSSLFEHDRSVSVGVTQWFTTDRAVFITLHLNEMNGRISAIKLFISLSGLHNLARLFFSFFESLERAVWSPESF